jgi:peptide/nickel transport system permease protein
MNSVAFSIRRAGRGPRAAAGARPSWFATVSIALVVLCAIFGPLLTPYEVDTVDLGNRLTPPAMFGGTWSHPLGTDSLGRDVLSRVLAGARVTVVVGIAVVALSALIGVTLGIIAGYTNGTLDTIVMAVTDIVLAFPGLLLTLVVLSVLGPSQTTMIVVLTAIGWMGFARLTRSVVIRLKETTFVESAVTAGVQRWRIVVSHLVPNLTSPVVTLATLEFARVVLAESALSYLGFGIQPPDVSWGLMVASGQQYMAVAWWLIVIPGLAIAVTVLSLNLIASWLRVAADPQEREKRLYLTTPSRESDDRG